MRAWQYSKTTTARTLVGKLEDSLTINEFAPSPNRSSLTRDQVIVEVASAALNPIDYKLPESDWLGKTFGISKDAQPGVDFSGWIAATHPSNKEYKEGQRVFGSLSAPSKFGALGQFIVASKSEIAPLPDVVTFDDAAALGTAAGTAYKSLLPKVVKPGSHVFINGGSGGVGTFAIQFAKIMGATVTATTSTANVQLVRSLGADNVLDYMKSDIVAQLEAAGDAFDIIIDNVGSPKDLYERSDQLLTASGVYVQVAANPTFEDMRPILGNTIRAMLGKCVAPRFHFVTEKGNTDDYTRFVQWMEEGKLCSIVSQTFAFEDVPKAYATLREGRSKGKVIVHVSERSKGVL